MFVPEVGSRWTTGEPGARPVTVTGVDPDGGRVQVRSDDGVDGSLDRAEFNSAVHRIVGTLSE